MLEVRLSAVQVDLQSNSPVILLQEKDGERSLPIFIGAPEATAIAFALQRIAVPRPMTHDLMKEVIEALGGKLLRVVVTEVQEDTYYAEMHLEIGGKAVRVSSRPSDAIALATRTRAPLFVEEELMDVAGVVIDNAEEPEESEELVDRFRQFLDDVSPEDFTS